MPTRPETLQFLLDQLASLPGVRVSKTFGEYCLYVDGRSVGKIQLVASSWRTYSLPMNVKAGDHELRLAFTNDFSGGGEDRNLSLDRATIYRDE